MNAGMESGRNLVSTYQIHPECTYTSVKTTKFAEKYEEYASTPPAER